MGIISFIKRSFLWWAALMFFRTVYTEDCNEFVVIVDVNASLVNPTNSYYNMSYIKQQNWTLPPTNLWIVNAPTQGNCSTKTCKKILNVAKLKDGYEVILEENKINLQFLLYANSPQDQSAGLDTTHLIAALFPLRRESINLTDKTGPLMGYLNYINVSVKDFQCTDAPGLNKCHGNSKYILYVQQNGTMNCSRCPSPSTSPSLSPPSSPSTSSSLSPPSSPSTSPSLSPPSSPSTSSSLSPPSTTSPPPTTFKKPNRNISITTNDKIGAPTAKICRNVMKNFSSMVQSLGNESSASLTMGTATGLLQKQDKEADVSLGYDQHMEWEQVDPSQKSELIWSVKIPAEAIKMSHSKDNGTPFVGVLRFPELSVEVDSGLTLASDIFGISMGVNITNLTDTIDICFRNISKKGPNMTCSSSDDAESWTTSGCSTKQVNNTITCSCTHLTFFAILMSEPGRNISTSDITTLTYITAVGCGLSTFFLLVGLFVHFVMWGSKSRLGTTILMNLFVALVLLNITFLSNQQVWSQHNIGCIIIAATMHFSMLATFTWFFIQGLHFYLILSSVNMKIRKYKLSYIGTGWGFPAIVVIGIASSGNYESVDYVQMCWITNKYIHYIVNVGYYSVVFIFTSVIFIMIIRRIIQAKQSVVKRSSKKTGAIFGLYVLLGLTWGVAFFSYGALTVPSYYIFTILNSFQGFFLFIYYYYFRNDEPEIGQSASSSDPSLRKPANFSSTELSEPGTVTEYN